MSDYIKRSLALEITSPYNVPLIHIDTLKQRINEIPAADVVEVVRCAQCRHFRLFNDGKIYGKCMQTDLEFMPLGTNPDTHFCAFGERTEK